MTTKNIYLQRLWEQGTYYQTMKLKISKILADFQQNYPEMRVFLMGWGNTSQGLTPTTVTHLVNASRRFGDVNTYSSYEDIQGNLQLRNKVSRNYYLKHIQREIKPSEIFITDGAQGVLTGILDLFDPDNVVALQNPYYPSCYEATLLSGRTSFIELPCIEEFNFIPDLPKEHADIIYLSFPNNPTGAVMQREKLQDFVNYAQAHSSIIIFDAVYSSFVQTPGIPKSIYEIDGADQCAIEICSFSKSGNLSGLRVGWVVVPHHLKIADTKDGELQNLWNIRNSIKFWGASNLAQQAAIGLLSEEGETEIHSNVEYYFANASLLKKALETAGLVCYGGTDNPYIWIKSPQIQSGACHLCRAFVLEVDYLLPALCK